MYFSLLASSSLIFYFAIGIKYADFLIKSIIQDTIELKKFYDKTNKFSVGSSKNNSKACFV